MMLTKQKKKKGIDVSTIVPCYASAALPKATPTLHLPKLGAENRAYVLSSLAGMRASSRDAWWEIVKGRGRVHPQVPNRRVRDLRH